MSEASEMFRVRVERTLLREASAVAEEMGTTPGEIVRLLFKQLVKRRAIPFPIQADAPEAEIFTSKARRNKLADEF